VSPWTASALFAAGILGLFLLNRDPAARTSKALWIPFAWLFIAGSRAPSAWIVTPDDLSSADDMYLQGNPFERNLFSVLLLLAVLVLFTRRRKVAEVLRGNAPILLFILYCAVSLLWSDFPDVGFRRWIKLVGDLAMILVVVTDVKPSVAFDRLITRTGFLIVPISILFIRYFPELGRSYEPWSGTMHWTGVTTNKNMLGLICMLVGLHAVWRIIRALRNRKGTGRARLLTVHGAMLVMVLYLLHEANSATSTSCFMLGSALIVAISLFRCARKPRMVHTLALGAVLLAACAAFFNFAGLVQQLGRKADLTGRRDLWAAVLSQPVSRMFGAGYESFWVGTRLATVERLADQFANQSHDGYIEILVNLGWVGIAFLSFLILTGYRKITRAVRMDPETNCLMLAYFVAALTYNFTEAAFKMMDPVWICFVWAVVSASIASRVGRSKLIAKPSITDSPQSRAACEDAIAAI
jgi:exopolysaccharide production protein ExoQ